MAVATKPKPQKRYISEESIEAKHSSFAGGVKNEGKKLAKDTLDSFWKQLLKGGLDQIPQQVMGTAESKAEKKFSGELSIGQEVSLKKQDPAADDHAKLLRGQNIEEINDTNALLRNELHQEYYQREIANIEIRRTREEENTIKEQVERILVELEQIKIEAKEADAIVKTVVRETTNAVEKPGKYHLNFFDWLLLTFRHIRTNLQENNSWAKTFASKKAERKYGNMAKKYGTTFSLSQERTTATQTG